MPGGSELFVSSVSLYELYMGAISPDKENHVRDITEGLTILPFSADIAFEAAKIYNQLKSANLMIEFRDIFIAATCIANDLPLATLNKKHFNRIKGLEIL